MHGIHSLTCSFCTLHPLYTVFLIIAEPKSHTKIWITCAGTSIFYPCISCQTQPCSNSANSTSQNGWEEEHV